MNDFCPWIDEYAEIYVTRARTARKRWRCHECGAWIMPGCRYQESRMLCGGRWDTFRHCAPCQDGPVSFIVRHCGSVAHEGVFEHVSEVFHDGAYGLPPGIHFRFGRWLVEARRRAGKELDPIAREEAEAA